MKLATINKANELNQKRISHQGAYDNFIERYIGDGDYRLFGYEVDNMLGPEFVIMIKEMVKTKLQQQLERTKQELDDFKEE